LKALQLKSTSLVAAHYPNSHRRRTVCVKLVRTFWVVAVVRDWVLIVLNQWMTHTGFLSGLKFIQVFRKMFF